MSTLELPPEVEARIDAIIRSLPPLTARDRALAVAIFSSVRPRERRLDAA